MRYRYVAGAAVPLPSRRIELPERRFTTPSTYDEGLRLSFPLAYQKAARRSRLHHLAFAIVASFYLATGALALVNCS